MNSEPEKSIEEQIVETCRRARVASRELSGLNSDRKDHALRRMAVALRERAKEIVEANSRDLAEGRRRGLAPAFLDRLELNESRLEQMSVGLEEIAALPDPVGEVVSQWRRPGGFEVGQVRIPLGVIGIIYESRPNVTADAAGLCFKAGNATILRGGSEALESNRAIARAVRGALATLDLNPDSVQVVPTADRQAVASLLKQDQWVDLIIPRGGKSLIRRVVEESRIPVIKHYEGICHVYVHAEADLEMALRIAVNAKTQRPGTCNAMETLLVDEALAASFLPRVAAEFRRLGVAVYGCPRTGSLIETEGKAGEEQYRTEYLGPTCNVRVVDGFEEAVEHIETFGSRHTDAIVTRSYRTARRFLTEVNSSSVMINASTRLADGGVYGLGAEIGISTDKLHAYGPMGVKELTAKKFFVLGDGQLRD